MITGENAIVVDKNIWLDFYLKERPLHEEAARFVRAAEKYKANLGTPADAVNEVFYIVGKYLKQKVRETGGAVDVCTARGINDFAWSCVDHMTDLAVSIPLDDRTAWLARHYRDITSDYEDGSVLAACELCKARYLVTHDKELAKRANIATKTAAEMADLISCAHRA
ncbi:PIN domain-containing protein [Adlercreutzia sp. R25]|uniref:PIN domain-containing protein n=1 Tax=Adlercreutzia shanghongiae TaxID=3111773 RepID=A0ABU6IZA2_9ACTN|nr:MULTISPECIES: PIN domain-containing protein [unclassified Adlercreutzia]MEC4272779.1 PIN domain-containing protein [Adlercreutzia sp. R25]MEC4295103.1 PIN domain-containing protein [Adlercreutzia sp. R22]